MSNVSIVPTPEQSAILNAALDSNANLMLTAYAGAAKTTTLELIAKARPWQSALALAFNVKIKNELERRLPNFTVMTLNGLGHRAWAKAISPRLVIEDKKLGKLLTAMSKAMSLSLTNEEWDNARRLVSQAMHAGLIPHSVGRTGLIPDTDDAWQEIAARHWLDASPDTIALCRMVLVESIKQAYQGLITYDDQIYMSALFGGVFPRYALVLVDEAQDLSPLNHIQLKRTAAGRIIACGDPKQAIYAFRGADSNSMQAIRTLRSEWVDLPLRTTFRCPHAVVRRQQGHAPGFAAWQKARPGVVLNGSGKPGPGETLFGKFSNGKRSWTWSDIPSDRDVAVLCRNNAPLISFAMKLLRRGIGCSMIGREIGKGLATLSNKLFPLDSTPADECVRLVNLWRDEQIGLARANEHDEKVAAITDRAECLLAVLEQGPRNAGELRSVLSQLFSQTGTRVVLSTIHRAKGLEWPVVLHLDPWRIPSRYAKEQAQQGHYTQLMQENNLLYVCETRTQDTLILANLEDFE